MKEGDEVIVINQSHQLFGRTGIISDIGCDKQESDFFWVSIMETDGRFAGRVFDEYEFEPSEIKLIKVQKED